MAVNLAGKYAKELAQAFTQKSFVDGIACKDYEFTGVKNLKVYTANKSDASLFGKKVSGSWKTAENAPYITVTIDGKTYEGVICTQKDESKNNTQKLVFSAVGTNNECI